MDSIASLFHQQVNVLKLFLNAIWGRKNNKVSLARFRNGLGRDDLSRNANDFHTCDYFFGTTVKSLVIALCIHGRAFDDLAPFKAWLSIRNGLKVIEYKRLKTLGWELLRPIIFYFATANTKNSEVSGAIAQKQISWLERRA